MGLVDLEDLVGFEDLEGSVDFEDLEGLLLVLVVLGEYQVGYLVDLVDRVCLDLPADLWVLLLLWVPGEY